jgi:hypothetical protein
VYIDVGNNENETVHKLLMAHCHCHRKNFHFQIAYATQKYILSHYTPAGG